MKYNNFFILSFLLLLTSITVSAQKKMIPMGDKVMFSLDYSGADPNPYGTLYRDKGYLRSYRFITSLRSLIVKNDEGEEKTVYTNDYDPVVSDSVIDVIYPMLKKAVAKKEKEIKKLEKKRKKYRKEHPDEIDKLGGYEWSVTINIRDLKFSYRARSSELFTDVYSKFWDKMEEISHIIDKYQRGYSQEDVDEMTENGKFKLPFNVEIYRK